MNQKYPRDPFKIASPKEKNEAFLRWVAKADEESQYERSDISAIAAASVVAENVVALEIARAVREKFGGDSMPEVRAQFDAFHQLARELPLH